MKKKKNLITAIINTCKVLKSQVFISRSPARVERALMGQSIHRYSNLNWTHLTSKKKIHSRRLRRLPNPKMTGLYPPRLSKLKRWTVRRKKRVSQALLTLIASHKQRLSNLIRIRTDRACMWMRLSYLICAKRASANEMTALSNF